MDQNIQELEILLVEDNPLDAELTMRSLKTGGLANSLLWVKDGQEALDYLFREGQYADRAQSIPRLVLLDVNMPKVNGVEVLKAIKADQRTRRIPVVMLTSSSQERDMADSYHLGVNSYMMKPVDFGAFAEIVRRAGYYWLAVNVQPGSP
ncbi:MAG TPA: response regulator [Burkholderiales bacterium]|jgi:CheY-like chemotaxis protein|nr:response regulator [Burkholderiales bacterium]